MRLVLLGFAVGLLVPVAHAETTTFGVAGAAVSVTTNDVPDCVASTPAPCVLGYDGNATLLPTDDTVYLNRSVDRVAITAPGAPSLDANLDEARVEHNAYSAAQDAIVAAHGTLPAPARSLFTVGTNDRNTNIGFVGPSLDGTQPSQTTYYVDVFLPYTNRTGTDVPNALGTDDSDTWVPFALDDARLCFVPELGETDAVVCDAVPARVVESAWPGLTPRVVTEIRVRDATLGDSGQTEVHARAARAGASGPAVAMASHLAPPTGSQSQDANAAGSEAVPLRGLQGAASPPEDAAGTSPLAVSAQSLDPPDVVLLSVALVSIVFPLLLLYHRITGRKALLHRHRARIHAIVAERPGCDVSALGRELGLSFKSTAHHVKVLQRGGFVRVMRHGRRMLVFRAGDEVAAKRGVALGHPTRARIIEEVRASPGVRQADLARRLGTGRNVIHAHVRVLVDCAVVVMRGPRLYLPVEDAPHAAAGELTVSAEDEVAEGRATRTDPSGVVAGSRAPSSLAPHPPPTFL